MLLHTEADIGSYGAEYWLKWINRDTGHRSDAAQAYIHSTRKHHSNLHLRCNTKVDKIVGNGVAVSVMTVPTKSLGDSKPKFYCARKLVIVSGGTAQLSIHPTKIWHW